MKVYQVRIKRSYETSFEIRAYDEEEAYQLAVEEFDELKISGIEMLEEDEEINEQYEEGE